MSTYKPLTNVTWASLDGAYLTKNRLQFHGWGWPAQADLAHGMHDVLPFLSLDTCRALVEATSNGLPVVVTTLNGHRAVGVVDRFYAAPNADLRLMVWGYSMLFPMCTVAKVEVMTAELLAPAGPVGAEPCGICQRPTEIIAGQRRHSGWSGDHIPPNYDPDARAWATPAAGKCPHCDAPALSAKVATCERHTHPELVAREQATAEAELCRSVAHADAFPDDSPESIAAHVQAHQDAAAARVHAELHAPGTPRQQMCQRGNHEACLRGECDGWEADPIDLMDEARGDFTPGM